MSTWRDMIAVHDAADIFPLLTQDELDELAADIRTNGMHHGVTLWTDQRLTSQLEHEWRNAIAAGKMPDGLCLLDGRNRLAAIELAFTDPILRKAALWAALGNGSVFGPSIAGPLKRDDRTDPYAYVVSANIHRRHLTAEQKREIVAELLRRNPERSDRATARIAGVSHPTVAAVRADLVQAGDVENVSTRTDSLGRQQPVYKEPTPLEIKALDEQKRRSARVMSGVGALELLSLTHDPANGELPPDDLIAARKTAAGTLHHLLILLRLDTAQTLDELVRRLALAKADLATVPKEKRLAAARGVLHALGLSDADLKPIA